MFTDEQKRELAAPLDRSHVKSRSQGGRGVSYIEGWMAIAEANRIFGFDGWTRETMELKCVAERERSIGRQGETGWGVTYIARIRVSVMDPKDRESRWLIREGSGAGHGIDRDLGQAHESALKEAETDAMKRALMTFGNPFGLALYDKDQAHVAPGNGSSAVAAPASLSHQAGVANPANFVSSGTIAQLLIKSLRLSVTVQDLDDWYALESTKENLARLSPADKQVVRDEYAARQKSLKAAAAVGAG